MNREGQLRTIQDYVYNLFHNDATGHDFFHMKRVARVAKNIAEQEDADSFICEAASWLHDVGDSKLFTNPTKAIEDLENFLRSIYLSTIEIEAIKKAIEDVSFSKGNIPVTLEGKIVQDADRIDAIGAVGIARAFAYGGANGQLIYHNEYKETSIQHFYDKLLKLKELLHTQAAKEIAIERHLYMEKFLEQFYNEW